MWRQRNKELQAEVEKLKSELKTLHELRVLEAQRHDRERIEMMESFTNRADHRVEQERQKMLRMKTLLEGWVRVQKKEVEQVMNRMKMAEEEVYGAAAEWRRLFCDALELRVGEIGQELNGEIESLDKQDKHDTGFMGEGKKRARTETSDGDE